MFGWKHKPWHFKQYKLGIEDCKVSRSGFPLSVWFRYFTSNIGGRAWPNRSVSLSINNDNILWVEGPCIWQYILLGLWVYVLEFTLVYSWNYSFMIYCNLSLIAFYTVIFETFSPYLCYFFFTYYVHGCTVIVNWNITGQPQEKFYQWLIILNERFYWLVSFTDYLENLFCKGF